MIDCGALRSWRGSQHQIYFLASPAQRPFSGHYERRFELDMQRAPWPEAERRPLINVEAFVVDL